MKMTFNIKVIHAPNIQKPMKHMWSTCISSPTVQKDERNILPDITSHAILTVFLFDTAACSRKSNLQPRMRCMHHANSPSNLQVVCAT